MPYTPLRPFQVLLDVERRIVRLTCRQRVLADAARAARPRDVCLFIHTLRDRAFLAERPLDPFSAWPVVLTLALDPNRDFVDEDRPPPVADTVTKERLADLVECFGTRPK